LGVQNSAIHENFGTHVVDYNGVGECQNLTGFRLSLIFAVDGPLRLESPPRRVIAFTVVEGGVL